MVVVSSGAAVGGRPARLPERGWSGRHRVTKRVSAARPGSWPSARSTHDQQSAAGGRAVGVRAARGRRSGVGGRRPAVGGQRPPVNGAGRKSDPDLIARPGSPHSKKLILPATARPATSHRIPLESTALHLPFPILRKPLQPHPAPNAGPARFTPQQEAHTSGNRLSNNFAQDPTRKYRPPPPVSHFENACAAPPRPKRWPGQVHPTARSSYFRQPPVQQLRTAPHPKVPPFRLPVPNSGRIPTPPGSPHMPQPAPSVHR
jgi:hypothetical protein